MTKHAENILFPMVVHKGLCVITISLEKAKNTKTKTFEIPSTDFHDERTKRSENTNTKNSEKEDKF